MMKLRLSGVKVTQLVNRRAEMAGVSIDMILRRAVRTLQVNDLADHLAHNRF